MKLSEKLAALEEEEKREAAAQPTSTPASTVAPARRKAPTTGGRQTWDATKRKVRELVLEEVAPKMQGLTGEDLTSEVKLALDRILQREDVQVSPLERRKFVQEMIADTLGYGPLDPLLADDTTSTKKGLFRRRR